MYFATCYFLDVQISFIAGIFVTIFKISSVWTLLIAHGWLTILLHVYPFLACLVLAFVLVFISKAFHAPWIHGVALIAIVVGAMLPLYSYVSPPGVDCTIYSDPAALELQGAALGAEFCNKSLTYIKGLYFCTSLLLIYSLQNHHIVSRTLWDPVPEKTPRTCL